MSSSGNLLILSLQRLAPLLTFFFSIVYTVLIVPDSLFVSLFTLHLNPNSHFPQFFCFLILCVHFLSRGEMCLAPPEPEPDSIPARSAHLNQKFETGSGSRFKFGIRDNTVLSQIHPIPISSHVAPSLFHFFSTILSTIKKNIKLYIYKFLYSYMYL